MMLGNARLRSGKASEAIALLERAAELAPQDPKVLGQFAIGQLASGETDGALAALNSSLDLDEEASALG